MPRIPQTRSLGALQRNICQSTSTPCSQTFSRALSTSATRSGVTDGLRKKLWKGEAPGPKDPYKKQDSKQDPRMQYLERNQGPLPPEIKQLAEEYFAEGGRRHGGRKVRVPGKRTEAAAEDDVKGADSTYVPATHISELDAVPLVKEWFDDPTNMGAGNGFHGFAPAKGRVITQPDIIKAHVWQALAEALCMRDAGRSARGVSKRLRVPSAALLDKVMQIEIEVLHGQAKIKDAQAAKAIADELRPMPGDSAHGEPIMSLEKAKKVLETAGEGWTDIILAEDVKFIVRPLTIPFAKSFANNHRSASASSRSQASSSPTRSWPRPATQGT